MVLSIHQMGSRRNHRNYKMILKIKVPFAADPVLPVEVTGCVAELPETSLPLGVMTRFNIVCG